MSQIKINHLAIVVENLDNSMAFWRDALGLSLGETQEVAEEAVKIAFFEIGNAHIELVQPTSDDSGVARFLAKRGQGMHHLCLEVENIEQTMRQLTQHNVELINETPRERDGKRYAFIHPNSTGGVLLELYELAKP